MKRCTPYNCTAQLHNPLRVRPGRAEAAGCFARCIIDIGDTGDTDSAGG